MASREYKKNMKKWSKRHDVDDEEKQARRKLDRQL